MKTELQVIQSLLARPASDPDVSPEFRAAAARWELELSSGKYLRLTEKQSAWLFKVKNLCDARDIGVPGEVSTAMATWRMMVRRRAFSFRTSETSKMIVPLKTLTWPIIRGLLAWALTLALVGLDVYLLVRS